MVTRTKSCAAIEGKAICRLVDGLTNLSYELDKTRAGICSIANDTLTEQQFLQIG